MAAGGVCAGAGAKKFDIMIDWKREYLRILYSVNI
jgi:hypothetical protein